MPQPLPPFDAIRDALERHQDIYITTHVGPDADAIGPALALKGALEARGKRVVYVSRDGVPHSSRFIARSDEVLLSPPLDFRPELAFVLDCDGTAARIASPMEPIENARERILIDHHRSSTPIFDINWIDPNQPATAMMIYQLLLELDLPIDEEMAEGLFAGLSCDTGHFRFSNTSPAALEMAAHLVKLGADAAKVALNLFDERSYASTKLLGFALGKMQLEHDGELAWTSLSVAEAASIGSGEESLENVVNFLRNIKGVKLALVFREKRDEFGVAARISVRARPEVRADLFAAEFEGGGHAAAAGCRSRGEFSAATKRVVDRAKEWLDETHAPVPM